MNKRLAKLLTRTHVWLYRATNGRLGSMGGLVLLLTTTGAKSGQQRTTPVGGIAHDEGWLLSAAANGAPRHPAWYHNIVANPQVTVTKGSTQSTMTARVAGPDERPNFASKFDRLADMEAKADREIPIIILEPEA